MVVVVLTVIGAEERWQQSQAINGNNTRHKQSTLTLRITLQGGLFEGFLWIVN